MLTLNAVLTTLEKRQGTVLISNKEKVRLIELISASLNTDGLNPVMLTEREIPGEAGEIYMLAHFCHKRKRNHALVNHNDINGPY